MDIRTVAYTVLVALIATTIQAEPPVTLKSRRELFVDDFLIGSQEGKVRLRLHEPKRNEIALTFDRPW